MFTSFNFQILLADRTFARKARRRAASPGLRPGSRPPLLHAPASERAVAHERRRPAHGHGAGGRLRAQDVRRWRPVKAVVTAAGRRACKYH